MFARDLTRTLGCRSLPRRANADFEDLIFNMYYSNLPVAWFVQLLLLTLTSPTDLKSNTYATLCYSQTVPMWESNLPSRASVSTLVHRHVSNTGSFVTVTCARPLLTRFKISNDGFLRIATQSLVSVCTDIH